tara:strand:- start:11056 stop:12543 length:1488 start_codon:yes stop_codon:yes gene_type:complete
MKISIFTLLLLLISVNCLSQYTYIPDDNFEQRLIFLGYDSGPLDDYVPTANINSITSLNVSSQNISDLTGIEDFTSLITLWCHTNQLTSIDISSNTGLTELRIYSNQLASLDVSNNTALSYLDCNNNSLTNIDLSANTSLVQLRCHVNQLTNLDVSNNSALTELRCYNNLLLSLDARNGNNVNFNEFTATNNSGLTCINVDDVSYSTANWTSIDATAFFSQNCASILTYVPDDNFEQKLIDLGYDSGTLNNYVTTSNISTIASLDLSFLNIVDLTGIENFISLTEFYCHNNLISSLDLSNNMALSRLYCYNNPLTNLNVSANIALTELYCHNNLLSTINLSSNTALTRLFCYNNLLTSLDIRNGNNTNILNVFFNTLNNPNLICISVDNEIYSTTSWENIDATTGFSVGCPLSLGEIELEQISIYPNPVSSSFKIVNNNSFQFNNIIIYDTLGKIIFQSNNVIGDIDVRHFLTGVYFVKVTSDMQSITKKIIVNK